MLPLVNLYELTSSKDNTIQNTEEAFKTFFPYLWKSIGGTLQFIFPLATNPIKSEIDLFKSKTSNLEVNICRNIDPSPNAYTIPAVSTTAGAQFFIIPLLPSVVVYLMYGLLKLGSLNLSAKNINKKVVFNSSKDLKFLMFETTGLIDMLKDEDLRFSVQLHEVGHWVNYEPSFLKVFVSIFIPLIQLFPPLAFSIIPIVIIQTAAARCAEYQADDFVKSVGYKDQLTKALDIIGYYKRTDISVLGKIDDFLRVFFTKFQDFVEKLLPIFPHPAIEKRKKALTDNTQIITDGFLDSSISTFNDALASFLEPVDKILAANAKTIFPLIK